MPSYQIFIPDVRGASPQHLRDVGLGDVLDPDFGPTAIDAFGSDGPDGRSGVVFYWHDAADPATNPQKPGMHLDSQIWTPCKPRGNRQAGAFYFGRDKGELVKPADLARRRQLPSLPVTLDDGQRWLVPVATRLPHRHGLDDKGEPVRRVVSRYQAWYQKAEEFFNVFLNRKADELFHLEGGFLFAIECLQMNYRVNADVIDWLELFTDDNLIWTIAATFELDKLAAIEAQKKKAS